MNRITVTRENLESAIRIPLRVARRHVWRKYEAHERLMAQKRDDPADAPEAHNASAEYLAGRFVQARWEVTHPEPKTPG